MQNKNKFLKLKQLFNLSTLKIAQYQYFNTQLQTEWRDLVVRREIIVGALALTISLEFEIFEEKLKSMAAPFHDKQPAMESESIPFQHLHQILVPLNFGFLIDTNQRQPHSAASNLLKNGKSYSLLSIIKTSSCSIVKSAGTGIIIF